MNEFNATLPPVKIDGVWHQHHRSARHPSFWIHTTVDSRGGGWGGGTRIAATNDYGDLVDLDLTAAVASFANGDH